MTIHTIHARFLLDEVTRGSGHYKAPGETQAVEVESAYVKLAAVQGEPFGAYTPFGKVEMFIVNPTAAEHFFAMPIKQVYDVVFFPRVEGKTHPVVANLTGEERDPNP